MHAYIAQYTAMIYKNGAFKVLMWKHYTVRKRRFFQTFMEMVAPISIVVVLFILKDSMQKKNAGTLRALSLSKLSEESAGALSADPQISYTPDSPATRRLLDQANENLWLSKFLSKTATRRNRPFSNTSDSSDWQYDEILIQFENMTGDALPDQLNYTIRIKHPYELNGLTREKFETLEPSLLLQWAIDSSFLKLRSDGANPLQNVRFEEITDPTMRAVNYYYVNTIFHLLPYASFFAPLLPFIFLMTRLLEERSTGIQELVKMVGVTPAMLGITQFLNSLPACLLFSVVTTVLLKHGGDGAMVPATNTLILFTGHFLHYLTIISMAYACSYLAREAQYTVSLSMFVYIGVWLPIKLITQESKSNIILFFLGLLPHCPVYWFLHEIHNTEIYYEGIGIGFNNWNKHYGLWKSGGNNGTVMAAFLMQLLQITIFFTLSWYMEKVRPGKYGIALPWNFLFQKEYWRTSHIIPDKSGEAIASFDPAYQKFFQEPPSNMEAGIKISHVSKIFGSGPKQCDALNNVTLDVYKGEITVLLGHNGAGKTTLMSIITGMINPTSGKIYVNGKDTVTQQAEVRKHLGLCPQHNLFFPDLTVVEHFIFFSMIKGGTFESAKKSSQALMEQLDLTDKANRKPGELSGGMLRRLQLGCALCGNASVLILDEPTSGLDVEARRELWDMLLALRGERTLLLTTHFMEEADVLGDRLAALHGGRLRCHATPMFLKRAVGSGFRLLITTKSELNEANITQCIRGTVGNASIREMSSHNIIYDLPAGSNLPSLFQNIERKQAELDIELVSIGITTLEEVFLELCCDVDTDVKIKDDLDKGPVAYRYVTGFAHTGRQMRALFRRQLDYTLSKKIAYVILQIVMPFVMCVVLSEVFNNADTNPYAKMSGIDIYVEGIPKKALYQINYKNGSSRIRAIDALKESHPDFEFRSLEDVHKPSCTCGKSQDNDYKKHLVGVELNDTEAKVLYKPSVSHSASVGLNLLSNILAMNTIPNTNGRTISTRVSNVRQVPPKIKFHIPKTKMNCALFSIFSIFILTATAINDVTLPCRERITVARHTHVMAGCPPILYWFTTFLYHMFGYTLFCCTAALVSSAFFDYDKTIDDKDTLMAYAVAVIICGMDFYSFAYFVSYYFNERAASMVLIGFTIVFGFLSPILMIALDDLRSASDPEPTFNRIMDIVGIVLPAHMFTNIVIKMTDTSRFNSYCKHNFDKCPNLPYFTEGFAVSKCCKEGSAAKGPYNHFAFTKYAMGWPAVIIAIQFVIFTTLVLLLAYGYCNRWWNTIGRMRATAYPEKQFKSQQVDDEKDYVSKTINLPKEQINDTLLLNNAWKKYHKLFGRTTFALRDANFSVKKGECFGLLGVNGAGKTTMFKLISCEESATKGSIYVNEHYLTSNPTQYMRGLGYCPQFFGLDDFRSGANNLRMLLIMRGFVDEDVRRETAAWLEVVGMGKYANKAVVDYSGGMVRRLATAVSLCSGSAVTLMDEPTAGVDTAARRLVWTALKRGTLHDRAIVLTSHNMDEMEMLCRRVTILTNGEMCVLGTPAALREEHAPGHRVVLKLRAAVVMSPIGNERVDSLKEDLNQKFDCTLNDKHLTSLHYRINESLPYSDIFTRMEAIESQFSDLVEDFSVADTTLEDVFLSFANN